MKPNNTAGTMVPDATSATNFRSLVKLWPWLKSSKAFLVVALLMIPASAMIESLSPIVVQRTIDLGISKHDLGAIYYWAKIYIGLVFASYFFRAAQAITTATAVHRMMLDMRSSLVRHVLRLPSSFHDKQLSGALATRATSDFDNLSESLNQGVLSSVIDIVALIGCIVGMFILSVKLALITLVLLPAVTWIVIWFSRKLNEVMMSARKKISALNGYTQEALSAMPAVKLLNATKQVSVTQNLIMLTAMHRCSRFFTMHLCSQH
jgi:ABC-type multidrug transport system fused ATPase/permease subunit